MTSFVVQFGEMTSKKVLLVATLGGRGHVAPVLMSRYCCVLTNSITM